MKPEEPTVGRVWTRLAMIGILAIGLTTPLSLPVLGATRVPGATAAGCYGNDDIIARITGTGGTVRRLDPPQGSFRGVLRECKDYRIVEQNQEAFPNIPGLNTRHRAMERIRHHVCIHGDRCLIFEGYDKVISACNTGGCKLDRLEVVLSQALDTHAMRFDDPRFLRFYLKVSPNTDISHSLISQVWQLGSTGNKYGRKAVGPALSASLTPHPQANKAYINFVHRNDNNLPSGRRFFRTEITKGQWYNFHMLLIPRYVGFSPPGRGLVLIWRNKGLNNDLVNSQAINYDPAHSSKYKFFWGFKPGSGPTDRKFTFDIRVGLYRPQGDPITFWMDSLKLTTSRSAIKGQ